MHDVCGKYEALQGANKILEEKCRLLETDKQRRIQTVADLEEHLQEARTELSLGKLNQHQHQGTLDVRVAVRNISI